MSVRTLENCMMETYMDCPYYEQMQFPMDTRLQAMFTYCVSTDVRLARKALEDYHCSMIPEGLIHGKYPSAYPQIISTFSLHYIYMLREFYEQTGEAETVKKYLPDIDMILTYYDRKIGDDGLVGRLGYWEFVDWQPAWAVLNGLAYGDKAKTVLQHAWEEEDVLKVTFSTSYEWFRALEKVGLYSMTEKDMELWKGLPALGCTTCPETPGDTRSDCHAWSALPIYEMVRTMAGISPEGAGWQKARIHPHMDYIPDLEGTVVTPKGTVRFSYRSELCGTGERKYTYQITMPEGLDVVFAGRDGKEKELSGGETYRFTL